MVDCRKKTVLMERHNWTTVRCKKRRALMEHHRRKMVVVEHRRNRTVRYKSFLRLELHRRLLVDHTDLKVDLKVL